MSVRICTRAEVIAGIERARGERPELVAELALYLDLAGLLPSVGAPQVPELDKESGGMLLDGGIPLLEGSDYEEVVLSSSPFAEAYGRVCEITTRHRPELKEVIAGLRPFSLELLDDVQQGGGDNKRSSSRQRAAFQFLLHRALHPFLREAAERLIPLLGGGTWRRPRCPVCGGQPDLAALSPETGERSLLCARCDAEWEYQRTGCPYCQEDTPQTWGYYPGEGGHYRLYACESCRRYLKTVDFREAGRKVCLPVERILTLGMDAAALQAGYRGA